jgi:hypothetical protein
MKVGYKVCYTTNLRTVNFCQICIFECEYIKMVNLASDL